MKPLHTLVAAALLALMAAPALAQCRPADATAGAAVDAPPMDPMPVAATAASATALGATLVRTITNGPVADTPEMRAKYRPLSRAGRATKSAGN